MTDDFEDAPRRPGRKLSWSDRIKAPLRRFALYRGLRFFRHLLLDPTFRQDHRVLWRRPAGLFQHRSITQPDRYPTIFDFVRRKLAGADQVRLLSFGCATGEEVFSLRRYLPRAEIKGVDISPRNIRLCRRRLSERGGDPGIEFAEAGSAAGEAAESYDAVFCMAVFKNTRLNDPALASCEPFLRFADFEAEIGRLARCLKPGGFLAIRHCNFHFSDTAAAQDFRPVFPLQPPGQPHPRFGRDNRRLPDAGDGEAVFQKCPTAR